MFIKTLRIGLLGLVLSIASAWAGSSSIQGVVKDAKGKPIKGADVRIEVKGGGKVLSTVKTDASGRYISQALPAGTYRVTLVVNGAVRSSINNTQTRAEGPTQLNFDLKSTSASEASAPTAKGKHYVWMPPKTGTHTGGRWVEVNDNAGTAADASNVQTGNAETVRQMQMHSNQIVPTGR